MKSPRMLLTTQTHRCRALLILERKLIELRIQCFRSKSESGGTRSRLEEWLRSKDVRGGDIKKSDNQEQTSSPLI